MNNKKLCKAGAAVGLASIVALTGCSAGSLGSSEKEPDDGKVVISMLGDNSDQTVKPMNALADAFNASQDKYEVKVETRPQGTDGDNVVKTRLATGEMTEVFQYNTGALVASLDPAENMVPIGGEDFYANIDPSYTPAVTFDDEVYGVPLGQATAGGILYNKKVYEDLDLEVPKTWDQFMKNNAKVKEAGLTPVIQSYGDTWTSQLFVLGDFHNVTAQDPEWAEKYTANQAKYAEQPGLRGFEKLQEIHEKELTNKDFASMKMTQALQALVDGKGAHYPILTFVVASYVDLADDAAENIGFMAIPGDDESQYGATTWAPGGLYISSSTEGEKLEAAKEFLAFVATPEACDAQTEAVPPNGPYLVKGCELPDGLPTVATDVEKYMLDGQVSPALEFLSPLKGPNLEKITVEVGSGIATAAEGAARYDEDVKKQAQQLGLEGW